MSQELGITCSYTLEASLSGYNGEHFSIRSLQTFGADYCLCMLDFLKVLNLKGDDVDLQAERRFPTLMNNCVQPRRRMSNVDMFSEGGSVGSDSNPSDDNLSESEVLMLLAGHTKTIRGEKVTKKKKKVRRKLRNSAAASNTIAVIERKKSRTPGPLRKAEPNKPPDIRSDVKSIYVVEFPQTPPS